MRWVYPGLFAATLILGVAARARADDHELTPRRGLPPRVVLRGCHTVSRFGVDFDGSKDLYSVEWRRCGPRNPNWKKERFPLHYLLVQPPRGKPEVLGLTFTNAGVSDEFFLNDVKRVPIRSGSRQMLLVSSTAYGEARGRSWCLLGLLDGQLQCWPQPEIDLLAAQYLDQPERMCCRDWTLQLHGGEIHLEHSVTRDGEPEGVIAIDLVPEESSLAVAGIRRVDPGATSKSAAKALNRSDR